MDKYTVRTPEDKKTTSPRDFVSDGIIDDNPSPKKEKRVRPVGKQPTHLLNNIFIVFDQGRTRRFIISHRKPPIMKILSKHQLDH